MVEWLTTYNETLGMYHASIFTTVFGAFAVTFAVIICWGKLVEDFGPAGGILAAGIIVGTFWLMNHKLPGFGIHPEQLQDAAGRTMQFCMIYQNGPWIDMGWAIGIGLWICGVFEARRPERLELVRESMPRIGAAIFGGVLGGAAVGLIGYTNSVLFGWSNMMSAPLPGK